MSLYVVMWNERTKRYVKTEWGDVSDSGDWNRVVLLTAPEDGMQVNAGCVILQSKGEQQVAYMFQVDPDDESLAFKPIHFEEWKDCLMTKSWVSEDGTEAYVTTFRREAVAQEDVDDEEDVPAEVQELWRITMTEGGGHKCTLVPLTFPMYGVELELFFGKNGCVWIIEQNSITGGVVHRVSVNPETSAACLECDNLHKWDGAFASTADSGALVVVKADRVLIFTYNEDVNGISRFVWLPAHAALDQRSIVKVKQLPQGTIVECDDQCCVRTLDLIA
jgi:hypothetical protein